MDSNIALLILTKALEELKGDDMSTMTGKKILFISPEFFGIDKGIIRVLEDYGATVFWFDERCVKSPLGRAVNSVAPAIFYPKAWTYYQNILSKVNVDIDCILIIKGEMISKRILKAFKDRWPRAQRILYLYDSVKNVKGIINRLSLYNRVISFDPNDCRRYKFEFRPLFCDLEPRESMAEEYDLCFYGTMYGDRFRIIQNLKLFCENNSYKFYSFCYLRGRFMLLFYWLTNSGFRKFNKDSISFTAMPSGELEIIASKSKAILDANDKNQTGLTMRTLEAVGLKKKIVTTNADIVNYDFYNPNNIMVIDRNEKAIPDTFFSKKYEEIDDQIIKKYTAKGWVDDVFRIDI